MKQVAYVLQGRWLTDIDIIDVYASLPSAQARAQQEVNETFGAAAPALDWEHVAYANDAAPRAWWCVVVNEDISYEISEFEVRP